MVLEFDLAIVAGCGSILYKLFVPARHTLYSWPQQFEGNVCILKFICPSHIKLMLVLYSKQYKSKYGIVKSHLTKYTFSKKILPFSTYVNAVV